MHDLIERIREHRDYWDCAESTTLNGAIEAHRETLELLKEAQIALQRALEERI